MTGGKIGAVLGVLLALGVGAPALMVRAEPAASDAAAEAPQSEAAPNGASRAGSSAGIDESFFAPGGELDRTTASAAAPSGASGEAAAPAPSIDLASSATKVLGSLFFVIALIVILFKLGRRAKLPFFGGEGIVRRIATEPIGPNQFINIVEIGGRILVLGSSEKNLQMLCELSGDALDRVRLAGSTHAATRSETRVRDGFASVMKSVGAWVGSAGRDREARDPREACAETLAQERDRLRRMVL